MDEVLTRRSRRVLVTLAGTGLLLALTAGPAVAGPDLCVSTMGSVRVEKGTATCSSVEGAGNVAIARGAQSRAAAGTTDGDEHNRSTATGVNSVAVTGNGDGNTATASGDGSGADAVNGDGNTATANGDRSFAQAGNGDGNTAIADTEGCLAEAQGTGTTATC